MNPRLYRKAALDRLSSPDDLDRTLTVTNARQWLVLLGIGIFVATSMVWAFVARVPTEAKGDGIMIGQGGVVNVVTSGGGVITDFKLKIGDRVKAGDVVAMVAQPEIVNSISQAKNRLEEARVDTTRVVHVQGESTRLQVQALDRQRATVESDIKQDEKLASLAADQIVVEQHLLDQGLTTKEQLIARQQKQVQIQADVQRSRAQLVAIEAQRFGLQEQPETSRRDAASRVEELTRQLDTLNEELKNSARVISPFSGEVVELKVYEGSTAVTGTPVLSLQPEVGQLEIVAFVPTSDAKTIMPGMAALVSPSTVKRDEYGYMKGQVTSVSDFPTTNAAAMRTFENESLVEALKSQGVVNEVRIALRSGSNADGYQWSSKKTPPQKVSSGTLCSIQVVTRERRPIELVMPFVKSFFRAD